ncbi:MAG: DUF4175 family protein [Polyangiales bacterium]
MHESQRASSPTLARVDTASRALAQYLTRVGRRVLWFKLVRGFAFTAGSACALLLACALLAGPSLSPFGAILTWSTVALGAVFAAIVGIGSIHDLAGARRAKLLAPYQPALAARARSAAELAQRPNGSPELIAVLAQRVTDELSGLPLAQVVRPPRYFRAAAALAGAIAIGCALLLASREDASAGLYAMLHPGARDDQGTLSGLWVAGLRAQLTFPAASGREPEQHADARVLEVPEGTLIELTLSPRYAPERAVLRLGERTLPWTRRDDGLYALSFTAEESARMELRARVGGSWITDATQRDLRVEKDAAPQVELLSPTADQSADLDQHVPFRYRVTDDHGLDGIDLVVQLGPSKERRQRLTTFPANKQTRSDEGNVDVVPAAFGARPGQTIAVWLEARDRDAFGGTNVGRSPVRTIRIGDVERGKGGPEVALLTRARDEALDALGERLESPLEGGGALRARKLAKGLRALIDTLSRIGDDYAEGDAGDPNRQLVHDMMRRVTKLLREEAGGGDTSALGKSDRALIAELEEDVLWLTDLVGRGKLEAAQESLARLAATRARMRKLLERLRETDDPGQRAELLAEIARARAELREVAEKLSEASADVPSDFVNYDALRRETNPDPLEELEKALAAGDMDAAEKALASLDERMASLEHGLEGGSESFRSERFGGRSAALDKTRGQIDELQQGQEQLARDTDKLADKARERGAEDRAGQATRERLAQQSEQLEKRTRELEAGHMQPALGEAQRTAQQRLRDARDALRQGESAEARNMAERAASDLEALAMEMRLDARMYPGHDGSRMGAAREAEELARDVDRFADQVAAEGPRDEGQLSGSERDALKKQAPAQGKLGEQADKLAREAGEEGQAGAPRGLERASESMRAAEKALEKGDIQRAKSAQRDALDRLRETSEELEQQAQASQGKRGKKRGGQEGERGGQDDDKVVIPESGEDSRRSALRRRVLDARRAATPDAFGRSVERYYQEILR